MSLKVLLKHNVKHTQRDWQDFTTHASLTTRVQKFRTPSQETKLEISIRPLPRGALEA